VFGAGGSSPILAGYRHPHNHPFAPQDGLTNVLAWRCALGARIAARHDVALPLTS